MAARTAKPRPAQQDPARGAGGTRPARAGERERERESPPPRSLVPPGGRRAGRLVPGPRPAPRPLLPACWLAPRGRDASAAWRGGGAGAHLGGAGVGVELGEPLVRAVLQRGEEHVMAPHAGPTPRRPAPRPPGAGGELPTREKCESEGATSSSWGGAGCRPMKLEHMEGLLAHGCAAPTLASLLKRAPATTFSAAPTLLQEGPSAPYGRLAPPRVKRRAGRPWQQGVSSPMRSPHRPDAPPACRALHPCPGSPRLAKRRCLQTV